MSLLIEILGIFLKKILRKWRACDKAIYQETKGSVGKALAEQAEV